MDLMSYVTGFAVGFALGRFSAGTIKIDPQSKSQILTYLEKNPSFTVNQLAEAYDAKNFLSKSKFRVTSSLLLQDDVLESEMRPGSTFLNRDETIVFRLKRPSVI